MGSSKGNNNSNGLRLKLPRRISLSRKSTALKKSSSKGALTQHFVIEIISAEKSGKKEFRSIVDDFFRPLASRFSREAEEQRLKRKGAEWFIFLEQKWEEFILQNLLPDYSLLTEELHSSKKGAGKYSFHPLILHYPLFCQRQIIAQLEVINPLLHAECICRLPGLLDEYQSFRDINSRQTPLSDSYYSILAFALASCLHKAEEPCILQKQSEFFAHIKSPHLHFTQLSSFFELLFHGNQYEAVGIISLQLAKTVDQFQFSPEQLLSDKNSEKTLVLPLVSQDTLVDLLTLEESKNSGDFFRSLPARVLEKLQEIDSELTKSLRSQLHDNLNSALKKYRSGDKVDSALILQSTWPAPFEFPQHAEEELLKLSLRDTNPISEQSLAQYFELALAYKKKLLESRHDAKKDLMRTEALFSSLEKEKSKFPWDDIKYDEELLRWQNQIIAYQAKLKRIDSELEELERKSERLLNSARGHMQREEKSALVCIENEASAQKDVSTVLAECAELILESEPFQGTAQDAVKKMIKQYKAFKKAASGRIKLKHPSALSKRLISAEILAIIWDWQRSLHLEANNKGVLQQTALDQFTTELVDELKKQYPEYYKLLSIKRPAAVYGLKFLSQISTLEEIEDHPYIKNIAELFSESSTECSDQKLYQEYLKLLQAVGSPLSAVRDERVYDIDQTAKKLLKLTSLQNYLFTTKERRILLSGWAEARASLLLVESGRPSLLSRLILSAVCKTAPKLHTQLASVIISKARLAKRAKRERYALKKDISKDLISLMDEEIAGLDLVHAAMKAKREAFSRV